MALSAYLAQQLAEWIGGITMPAAPAAVYVALFDALDAELTGNGYARIALDSWGAVVDGAGVISIANNQTEVGSAATGSAWSEATQFAFYDAATDGNALSSLTALTASRTVTVGGVPVAASGAFTFAMQDSVISTYLATAICEWIGGTTFPAAPASVYLGYFATGPTELTGDGYARTEIATWETPTDQTTSYRTRNDAELSGATATSDWTDAPIGVLYDAATAGNALSVALTFATSIDVSAGGYPRHAANQISISFLYE